MAGSFPDVPGRRMAYDLDGTVGLFIDDPVITRYVLSDMITMNNESTDTVYAFSGNYPSQKMFVLIFPELRDIVGCVLQAVAYNGASAIATSPDTTNGLDGAWTSQTGGFGNVGRPSFRTINAVNWTNVRGLRFTLASGGGGNYQYFYGWHLYGNRPQVARLAFWDPTVNQELGGAFLDWGNMGNAVSSTRQVRIKNLHAVNTANNIVIATSTMTDTTPGMASNHSFSADNVTFSSTLNIGSLAPGVISSAFYVKITTPTGNLGTWSSRLTAIAGSWT